MSTTAAPVTITSVRLPPAAAKELRIRAATNDSTVTIETLKILKASGLTIPDEDLVRKGRGPSKPQG